MAQKKRQSGQVYDFKHAAQKQHQQLQQAYAAANPATHSPSHNTISLVRKTNVDLIPKNIAQEDYVEHLLDPSVRVTIAVGPAGTGKTLLAVLAAIKALKEGTVQRIVITRPAVSVDEEHGFLPGTMIEKMAPWTRPIMDVFEEFWHPAEIEKMMYDNIIEVAPLAYMRGRTFHNSYIIFDESQNSTENQMKMALTRIGRGSYMSVTGDLNQHDRGYTENGLKNFVERLEAKGSSTIGITWFSKAHVERDPMVTEILSIYGED